MQRQIIFTQELLLASDVDQIQNNDQVSLAKALEALIGTDNIYSGLECVPHSPPSLVVNVNPGQGFRQLEIDATDFGPLPVDTHLVVKQGILLDVTPFTITPPATVGYEQQFLIEAEVTETDNSPVPRSFYNSGGTNGKPPIVNNVPTTRKVNLLLQLKAGVAAPTGTSVTPSPDAGWDGLWVIKVQNGQTTITSDDIALYPDAPFLKYTLKDFLTQAAADIRYAQKIQVQTNSLIYCDDSGTIANFYKANPTPAITSYVPGLEIKIKIAHKNDGASVLNVSSLGNKFIKTLSGDDVSPSMLTVGLVAVLIFDGTNFQLQNPSTKAFTTGDAKLTWKTTPDFGWILADDGTIGSATSGATNRANADTQPLFELIWNSIADIWSPVSGGRGVSASADFAANKTLMIPKILGRALCGAGIGTLQQTFTANTTTHELTITDSSSFYTGTSVILTTTGVLPAPLTTATTYYVINVDSTHIKLATSLTNAVAGTEIVITDVGTGIQTLNTAFQNRIVGSYVGQEEHALTISEIPNHNHSIASAVIDVGSGGAFAGVAGSSLNTGADTTFVGGSIEHNIMQPSTFLNVLIKL